MNFQNNIFAAYGGAPRSRIGIDVAAALELPFRVDEPMPLAVALPVVVDLLDVRVVAERVDIARGEVFIDSRRVRKILRIRRIDDLIVPLRGKRRGDPRNDCRAEQTGEQDK